MQPLAGVKVVDFSRALAGPLCSLLLADMGAEVIKVEPPGIGDDSREWPPLQGGESCYFVSFNRNKRSIVLDLATPEGQEIARGLVKDADVLVENYRAGVMAKWGLGWEQLRELNPRLIYCAISGFGRTGPMADKPATDIYMQAFSGLMSITGEPGGTPMRSGVSICDLTCGMFAGVGVLGALRARDATGKGQLVEASLLESQIAFISYLFTSYVSTGKVPQPLGSGHSSIVPYQAFKTKDGWVTIATFNDRLWQRAAKAMGVEHLARHPDFDTNPKRLANRELLVPQLQQVFLTRSTTEWVEIMDAADVPLAPVQTVDQVAVHPQVLAREMMQIIDHPRAGPMTIFGFPLKFSDTPCELRHLPPVLGQHTREILAELGLGAERVQALIEKGVAHEMG